MCGIAGIFEYEGRSCVETKMLERMLSVLYHRGPDDVGMFSEERIGIGMRRLSIIDINGGKQPISNEDGTITVVFNGEIYNYRELQDKLRDNGHILSTCSDTEVIVHLYEELGEDCVRELRGMFAFAVWDSLRHRLFIARDRLGIKPLYYKNDRGRVVFASEIKALLQHPEIEASLSLASLGHYLSLKYVPAPQTMFADIVALPPAHTLTCDRKGIKMRRYWSLSFVNNGIGQSSEEDCADQLETLLRESVRMHLVSDVPFGAFLSGGVDSSLIVALMSQILDRPVRTFSVGFEGKGSEPFSELPYARLVAERFVTDHYEVHVKADDLMNLAEDVIWHLDQPIADNACVANYMVSRLAAQHVKMVVTGEGADELFGGYARYAWEQMSWLIPFVPEHVRSSALKLVQGLPGLRRPKIASFALCHPDEVTRLVNWFPLFNRQMKSSLLTKESFQQLVDPYSEEVFRQRLAETDADDRLSRMLYVDTKLWLPDDLLARGDKTSMAASIEARIPFLDHKLVEFAACLPPHMKVKRLSRKYLLRKIARRWLPTEVVDRKKAGFPMPFSSWFRKEARCFVHDLLSPSTVKRRGLFSPAYVETLLADHDTGAEDHSHLLWGLLSVELWHRAFLDSATARVKADCAFVTR